MGKAQLEVFHRALETENQSRETDDVATSVSDKVDGLSKSTALDVGDRIEKFHSQLVLEAVNLRSELAGLRKKKWILRSVLANGGECEQRAIECELAELRSSKGSFRKSARSEAEDFNSCFAG